MFDEHGKLVSYRMALLAIAKCMRFFLDAGGASSSRDKRACFDLQWNRL